MRKFITGLDREQRILFPEKISNYIPKHHFARLILEILEKLDLSNITKKYSHTGKPAYNPSIMLPVLLYGYSIGVRSSRKLATACETDLIFMFLATNLKPSHNAINDFRRLHLKEINDYFVEVLLIAQELKLVELNNLKVSIDGTKIRANASNKKTKTENGLKKLLKKTKEFVKDTLDKVEEINLEEDVKHGESNTGNKLAEKLQGYKSFESHIKMAQEELKRKKEGLRSEINKQRESAKKGLKLTKREQSKIDNARINITDNDADFMQERNGSIRNSYNAQASVDEKNQIIVACDVTTEHNDQKQLIPMINLTEQNSSSSVKVVKADSGYNTIENLSALKEKDFKLFLNDSRKLRVNNPNFKYDKVNFKYDIKTNTYECPAGKKLYSISKKSSKEQVYRCQDCLSCPLKNDCSKKNDYREIRRGKKEGLVEENRSILLSDEGKKEYQIRMHTVEPVFGDIKYNKKFVMFSLRGLEKVKLEFVLVSLVQNIKKIFSCVSRQGKTLKECLV